jgi:predicted metal-dependent phosphoesterase TrpH
VLKVELHCHTNVDPADYIPYSTREYIDRAAELGFHAIAVTPHDAYFDPGDDGAYARARGISLISGIERTIRGKHLLLLNFPRECTRVSSFEEVAQLRSAHPRGLVIAPHPFYPNPSALRRKLVERHAHLFDALEVNSLYTPLLDFNAAAIRWARERGKPLVGNSDLHLLDHLGITYSLVDAEPTPDAICDAIRHGDVEVRTRPLSNLDAGWTFARMVLQGLRGRLRHRAGDAH